MTGAHLLFTWNQPQRWNQRLLWRNFLLSCSDSLLSQPTFRLASYCFLISGTRWCPTGAGTTARCAVTDCLNVSAGRQRGCPSLGCCYWSRWIMCLCPKSLLKTVFSTGAVIYHYICVALFPLWPWMNRNQITFSRQRSDLNWIYRCVLAVRSYTQFLGKFPLTDLSVRQRLCDALMENNANDRTGNSQGLRRTCMASTGTDRGCGGPCLCGTRQVRCRLGSLR